MHKVKYFLPRDAMQTNRLPMSVCPSLCLSFSCVVETAKDIKLFLRQAPRRMGLGPSAPQFWGYP